MFRMSATVLLSALMIAPAAHAQQKAHEHGHWQMNAAIESDHLHVELIAPGADVVGFEHEAKTPNETAKVWKAKQTLAEGSVILVLPAAAGCELEKAHVEVGALVDDHHDDKKHDDHKHDHDKHDHKDDHKHAHKDDHKDDHKHGHKHDDHKHDDHAKHDDHHGEAHNEFHAEYEFHCENIAKLETIGVTIFEVFPSTEEIDATVLTAKGQRAAELDKNNTVINLEGLL